MGQARYSVNIGAGGTGTIRIRTNAQVGWHITQISIENKLAAVGSYADIRSGPIGQPIDAQAFVSAMLPRNDSAVEPPALDIDPTSEISVNWYLCPNSFGSVWIIYDEVKL